MRTASSRARVRPDACPAGSGLGLPEDPEKGHDAAGVMLQVNLSNASVQRADLREAHLEDAILTGPLLEGADPRRHDNRNPLLRSFAQLSGELRSGPDGLRITLDQPDDPSHRRALRGLCSDLNQLGVTFPDTEVPVTYHVGMYRSEAAA
jgi:hypothetical protein